jgi:hypothetical protein
LEAEEHDVELFAVMLTAIGANPATINKESDKANFFINDVEMFEVEKKNQF